MASDLNDRDKRDSNIIGVGGSPASGPGVVPVGLDVATGGDRASVSGQGSSSSSAAGSSIHDDRHRVQDAVRREASDAGDAARSATESLKGGFSSVKESAKERLVAGADSGKEQISSGLGDFAAAVRKASDELGQKDQSLAAHLMRQVASGVEQASDSVGGRDIHEISRSVSSFARRQPATFLVGAALAGFAIGRVVRASGKPSATQNRSGDFEASHMRRGTGPGYGPTSSAGASSSSSSGLSSTSRIGEPHAPGESSVGSYASTTRPSEFERPRPAGTTSEPGTAPSSGSYGLGSTTSSFGDRNVR